MAVPHFLRTFNVPLFVPLPYFICGCFSNFSTHRNKSLHTQGHLSFASKDSLLYCCLFSSISLSVCLKFTIWNVVTFLLSLLSAILIVVAFCHLQVSHHSVLLAFMFVLLFSCDMAIAVSPLLFSLLGLLCHSSFLSAIFNSSRYFCHASFIAAVHFKAVQPAIIAAFHASWTFLLLSCYFCSGSVVTIFILLLNMFSW